MAKKPPPRPIKPTQRHARAFEGALRRIFYNPFFRGMEHAIEQIQRDYLAAREAIRNIPRDPKLASKTIIAARTYITELEAWHRRQIQQTIMRYWGIDGRLIMRPETVRPIMMDFIEENVNLITRLDTDTRARMLRAVEESFINKPGDRNAIAKDVRREMRITGRRVKLIARDQTNKGIGQLTGARQTEAGIERYEWSDSGDQRVRALHRENNGYVFSWNEPPPTGHPGHAINCRCAAIPKMPSKPPTEQKPSKAQLKWERETNA